MKKFWVLVPTTAIVLLNMLNPFFVNAETDMDINKKQYLVEGELVSREQMLSTLCQSDLNSIRFKVPTAVAGKNIDYYCTYSNRDSALEEMLKKYDDAITFMRKYVELPETFDSTNIDELQNGLYRIFELANDIPNRIVEELTEIQIFFDIYENDEVNDQIDELISAYNSATKMKKTNGERQEILNQIDELIPLYSENFGTIETARLNMQRVGQINVSAATQYAVKYASTPNRGQYHYFSNGDCTNFTSQILEAAGIQQIVYESEHSGWWHKKVVHANGHTVYTTHTHSRSWTMADVFARYMGVTLSTTSLQQWSRNVSQGDFIGLDFANDGNWNHVGYVTETGSLQSYESELGQYCIPYYDVKIAQHTSNYHDWTSSSKNSWETYAEKGRYGIIRG